MDEDSTRSSPLTPLQEDEETPQPDQEIRTPPTSTFQATDLFFPESSRRRRLLNRFTRFGEPVTPGTRSPPNFIPQAVEFVPSKMAPKRKASSSARAGKSTLPALRANSASSDQPTISAEDLFGGDSGISRSVFENILGDDDISSDIFELEMQDLRAFGQDPNATAQHRDRLQEAFAVMRHRVTEKARPVTAAPQSRSALLFTFDRPDLSDAVDASSRIRYLPLCPASTSGRRESISKETNLTVLPSAQQQIDDAALKSTSSRAHWPAYKLPVEIFALIIDHLSRDDVKSMRLVNKESEEKVSCSLFSTSVVPFNTELYDMIDEDARAVNRVSRVNPVPEGKGKGRARDAPETMPDLRNRLHWQNAKDDAEGKVYRGHGLRVFQGFGPHIKRFGMSFEVAESQLSRPPIKKELDHVESYFGSYDWPTQQYTRFAGLAGLERTADDTLRMKAAFSNLKNVRDLGLSLDSGLGWLNGPDKSMRAQIFDRPSSIFGESREIPDRQTQEAQDFWAAIQSCHRGLGVATTPKEVMLVHRYLKTSPGELRGLQGTRYADSRRWPSIAASKAITSSGPSSLAPEDARSGVLYTTFGTSDLTSISLFDKSALVPGDLRKEQKEWLLETEWAQRAFLECYMLAVIDNPVIFGSVKTLNISKLSSSFLPLFANEHFWNALPTLSDVTVHVKPDWRTVEKDNAGFAETSNQNPSEAVRSFNRFLLRDGICLRPSITSLNVGWSAGGEHAEGIFARNAHLLPAPINQLEHSTAAAAITPTVFKHVEHLTLANCWITPVTLGELIRTHADMPLKKLTLDSVSLTAHPRFAAGGQQHQHLLHAFGALQQQHLQHQVALVPGAAQLNANQNNNQLNPPVLQMFQQLNQPNPPVWGPPQAVPGGLPLPPQNPPPVPFQNPPTIPFLNGFNAQNVAPHIPQGPLPQWMNLANGPLNVPAAPPPPPSHWTAGHREGSWPDVLDRISPGAIFNDYLPQPQPWGEQFPERAITNLHTLELKSCGYAKLTNNNAFDQYLIDANFDHHLSTFFRTKQLALNPAMMSTADRFIARIVQHIPQRELDAVLFAWGLTEGWEDRAKAEEAEYDGLLAGGTGRISGRIEKGMALIYQPEVTQQS